jgi:hypothetical protein
VFLSRVKQRTTPALTSTRRWCGVTITYLQLCLADKKRQRHTSLAFEKAKARLVFLHYECMADKKRQRLAFAFALCFTTSVWSRRKKSNCSPTGVLTLVCPGLCVCVFVCVFVRCLCAAPCVRCRSMLRRCRSLLRRCACVAYALKSCRRPEEVSIGKIGDPIFLYYNQYQSF